MKASPCKILHITPHLGGGVGRVVLNYLSQVRRDPAFLHRVACLDYANPGACAAAKAIGVDLSDRMSGKKKKLLEMAAGADIVLIHWWNHPLLYDFLVRCELPPSRVIMWSHISGFNPPYVFTRKVFGYPDLFVFTTPVSFQAKEVKALSAARKSSLRVVWSTGGVEHARHARPKRHAGFNIGYIGTVDYCKLHPDFFKLCSGVDVPGAHFIVCGGPREQEFRLEAESLGLGGRFDFTGLVQDIGEYLPLFDVFGYPLAPYHYGTCDQALAESMAAGVVPVVLANRMENYMVRDGETGIVAKDGAAYVNGIKRLYADKNLRRKLSANAKAYAVKTFSLKTLEKEWLKVFEEVLALPKTARKWRVGKRRSALTANDIFLESLGAYGRDFTDFCRAGDAEKSRAAAGRIRKLAASPIWQADTRGTVHHYNAFFPGDPRLVRLAEMMRIPIPEDKGKI